MRNFNKVLRLVSCAAISAFAGGLMHNTNQSVDFVRNFAQDASVQTQAVYYNPAGLAFGTEGLHVQLHNQTIFQTRTVTAKGLGEYEGESFVPAMPSIFVDYHRGHWNVFGGFMIIGGGGKADFDDGLPMIDALLGKVLSEKLGANAQLSGLLKQMNLQTGDLFEASFEGTQYIYGFTLGGAYRINDMFSVALGARFNYATNFYEGEMKSSGAAEKSLDALPEAAVSAETKAGIKKALAGQLNQTLLDCEQSGFGFTPFVGVHFQYKNLNAAVKYEHNTSIEVENETDEITETVGALLPQFLDGAKSDNDMPAFLSVGVSYSFFKWLRAAVGYHHYFDTFADYAGDKEDALDGDENEFVFGAEIDPIERLTLSFGVQRTLYGLSDEYIEDMSFNLNSWSLGGGFAVRITDWLRFQAGYMVTLYESWNKTDKLTKLRTTYERTSHNIGVGVNLDF